MRFIDIKILDNIAKGMLNLQAWNIFHLIKYSALAAV